MPAILYSTGSSTVMMLCSCRSIGPAPHTARSTCRPPDGPADEQRAGRLARPSSSSCGAHLPPANPRSTSVGGSFDWSSRTDPTSPPRRSAGSRPGRRESGRRARAAQRQAGRPAAGAARRCRAPRAPSSASPRRWRAAWGSAPPSPARTPSIRKRTTSASSCWTKWTSLAPSSLACRITELTRRTSGASSGRRAAGRPRPARAPCSAGRPLPRPAARRRTGRRPRPTRSCPQAGARPSVRSAPRPGRVARPRARAAAAPPAAGVRSCRAGKKRVGNRDVGAARPRKKRKGTAAAASSTLVGRAARTSSEDQNEPVELDEQGELQPQRGEGA